MLKSKVDRSNLDFLVNAKQKLPYMHNLRPILHGWGRLIRYIWTIETGMYSVNDFVVTRICRGTRIAFLNGGRIEYVNIDLSIGAREPPKGKGLQQWRLRIPKSATLHVSLPKILGKTQR